MRSTHFVFSGSVIVDLENTVASGAWTATLRIQHVLSRHYQKAHAFVHFIAANAILTLDNRIYSVSNDRSSVQVNSIDGSKHLACDAWSALNESIDKARSQVG